ncbi:MAG: MerR family transcriptional regulator [Dorea sp.]|nr:MerR family transcriptional regulator [Dorea sp.]
MYSANEAAKITGLSTAALRYYENDQLCPLSAR